MYNIEMTVFDMAGTTVNEDNVVYKTVQKALKKAGYEVDLELVLEQGAGKEKRKAIEDVIKLTNSDSVDQKMVDLIFADFKKELELAYDSLHVTSYEGTEELFKYLRSKKIKVVLNTGYDLKTANKLLEKLGWEIDKDFDLLVTADDVRIGRPTSEMIDLAMSHFLITDSKKVLKAGDSVIDIEEGKNARCGLTVGVLTGAQTEEQLKTASPTIILESLTGLKDIL